MYFTLILLLLIINTAVLQFFRSELSDSPKRSALDSPSPTREQKARQAVAEATASATASGAPTKWKMPVGSSQAGSSRFKRKTDRDDWLDEINEVKRLNKNIDPDEPIKKSAPSPMEKNLSVRKAMALKEPVPKKIDLEVKKPKVPQPIVMPKPIIPPGQVVLDKFGNFRLMTPPKDTRLHGDMPPLPPGVPPKSLAGIKKFMWLSIFVHDCVHSLLPEVPFQKFMCRILMCSNSMLKFF